ncbi:MAG: hypothetical protein ORN58_03170, partial [Sediminibacterium sp.]|nr:hypothetical protein [Sediminibacterium sp.]
MNNPLKYNDPSGNNPLLIAALVGGFINAVFNAGNINNVGDFFKYFAVGAISGLAGYGAGTAVTASVGSLGFIAGAATGAASGSAAGFVSGFGNSLVGGASFVDALGAGVHSVIIGAATGAAIGGISGGIQARKMSGDFWTGEYKGVVDAHLVDNVNTSNSQSNSTENVNGILENRMSKVDANIIKQLKETNTNVYTGQTPKNVSYKLFDEGAFYFDPATREYADGLTFSTYDKINFSYIKSSIYLSPRAVIHYNDIEFYGLLIHELSHVNNNFNWGYALSHLATSAQREYSAYINQANYYYKNNYFEGVIDRINTYN